ncbi:MAG: DUF433 domain-containing protein [Chloroflexota bacterium]
MMSQVNWRECVVIDLDIYQGDPCIKGTRIPVTIIVGSLAGMMTSVEITEAHPHLTVVEIRSALAYSAAVIQQEVLVPLVS